MREYGRDNRRIKAVRPERVEEVSELRHPKGKKRRNGKRNLFLFLFLLLFLFSGVRLFHRFAHYDSYAVVWQKDLGQGSLVGYEAFGQGLLKYSKDGVTFLGGRGQESWVDAYEMKNPAISVNGNYAVIADMLGNAVRIYNLEGKIGEAVSVLPLTKVSVARNGITAVIEEDASSAYIVFFGKDGNPLDITVKSILSGDGYPTDISLSSEGNRLMVSYAYLSGGDMRGRVVFYDFSEIGKNIPNRLVGGFDEPFADALVADICYMDDTYSFALSTEGISFFSSRNLASPELIRQVAITDEIQSVFYNESYVGVITNNTMGEMRYRMEVYGKDGEKATEFYFDEDYKSVSIDGKMIFVLSSNKGRILHVSGVQKFYGDLDFPVVYMKKGPVPGEFLMAGPSNLKAVRLR